MIFESRTKYSAASTHSSESSIRKSERSTPSHAYSTSTSRSARQYTNILSGSGQIAYSYPQGAPSQSRHTSFRVSSDAPPKASSTSVIPPAPYSEQSSIEYSWFKLLSLKAFNHASLEASSVPIRTLTPPMSSATLRRRPADISVPPSDNRASLEASSVPIRTLTPTMSSATHSHRPADISIPPSDIRVSFTSQNQLVFSRANRNTDTLIIPGDIAISSDHPVRTATEEMFIPPLSTPVDSPVDVTNPKYVHEAGMAISSDHQVQNVTEEERILPFLSRTDVPEAGMVISSDQQVRAATEEYMSQVLSPTDVHEAGVAISSDQQVQTAAEEERIPSVSLHIDSERKPDQRERDRLAEMLFVTASASDALYKVMTAVNSIRSVYRLHSASQSPTFTSPQASILSGASNFQIKGSPNFNVVGRDMHSTTNNDSSAKSNFNNTYNDFTSSSSSQVHSFIYCDFSQDTESQENKSWLSSWLETVTTGHSYIKSSVDSYLCVVPGENSRRGITLKKFNWPRGNAETVEDRELTGIVGSQTFEVQAKGQSVKGVHRNDTKGQVINLNVKESAKVKAKRKHRSFLFCDFGRGTESWPKLHQELSGFLSLCFAY
ncbi:hypothetical protein GYMLUDRAFT_596521 [Collybiopsis luxurians FD-317 M1]|uniref:Uncharacterized protein n=1 Tax=Collybiopsis luxurians FD-317 M1 TaxID=944289 RepID=A0A0D0CX88_9AGAR|nr:hypothetical protein GYMLUDRAFT_596521 [Collybiopsis luxurians FD-317 M1]